MPSAQDIRQYQNVLKMSRGSFKVSTAHANFAWLQVSLLPAWLHVAMLVNMLWSHAHSRDHLAYGLPCTSDGSAPVCCSTCAVQVTQWHRCCVAKYTS
jgi:hypothetical protein